MSESKSTVIVIGHSFVYGFCQYLKNKLVASHSHDTLEVYAANYLNLNNKVDQVLFMGESGATIMDDFRLPTFLLRICKPTIVILDIGTNDIVLGHSTSSICAALVDTATHLRELFNVSQVLICSCLRRERCFGNLSVTQFNDLVVCLNTQIAAATKYLPGINYHTHRGFWKEQDGMDMKVSDWSNDGIHPNSFLGRRKYSKSLQRAVHVALSL